MRVTNLHWSLSGYTSPRSVCHLNPNPKFILTPFYINIISFLQFPPGGTKSPPGQRSGAESVRRAGGVKIPVFISIPSSNLAPFYPLAPFTTIPSASLRSFSFRFLGVFLFSHITQDVRFVLSSNPIPLRSMVFFLAPSLTSFVRLKIRLGIIIFFPSSLVLS